MPEHEDFYTSAQIDEQVDALLQARSMPARDQRMADDLRAILEHEHENARSLQSVLHKLQMETSEQQARKIVPLSEKQQQGRSVRMQITSQPQTPSKRRPIARLWSALAAALVIVVLVGSMLFILNGLRQQKNGTSIVSNGKRTATTVAQTPAPALQEGQVLYTSQRIDLAMPVAWSPDGKRVATAIDYTNVKSWDVLTGKNIVIYTVAGNSDKPGAIIINDVTNVAWSPDGSKLLVAENHTIYLFDAGTARLIRTFTPSALAESGTTSGPLVATRQTGQKVPFSSALPLSGTDIFGNAVWSPDGQYIAATYDSGWEGSQSVIYVWDAQSGALVKKLSGFSANIISVSWSSQENRLAALGYDGLVESVKVWDTGSWSILERYANTFAFDWSPDGTQLALVEEDSTGNVANRVRIIDASTGKTVKQFATPAEFVSWSPDGTRLAVGSGNITLWSVSSGALLYTFPQKGLFQATWSPDSKYISCVQGIRTGSGKNTAYDEQILILAA